MSVKFSKIYSYLPVLLGSLGFCSVAAAQVDQPVMDASAEQAQGNYQPMNMG